MAYGSAVGAAWRIPSQINSWARGWNLNCRSLLLIFSTDGHLPLDRQEKTLFALNFERARFQTPQAPILLGVF